MTRTQLQLGAWISIQMIMLALMAVTIVAGGMWFRYERWYKEEDAHVPADARVEMRVLEKQRDNAVSRRRLAELESRYYDDPSMRDDAIILGSLILGTIPVIILVGFWASSRITVPVINVTRAANRVAKGDLHIRAKTVRGAPAELQKLSRDFNLMAERLESYDRERRDSSAAIAHEIRTPLTAAKARLQGVLDGVFALETEQIEMVVKQLEHLNRLVDDLQTFSLALAGQLELNLATFRLKPLVEERLNWALPRLRDADIRSAIDIDENIAVHADRGRLGQVLSILIDNVVRHATSTDAIRIITQADPDGVRLMVLDRGPGIPEEALPRIFERFSRGDPSRMRNSGSGGTGLGLSIAQAICDMHGYSLAARNREGGGAAFHIVLPEARLDALS
jgi:signal transduction histidine kinase